MIRSFCSADQVRRRSTIEIISDDMCLTVLKHVNKDSMIHQNPPGSATHQCRSPERTLTYQPICRQERCCRSACLWTAHCIIMTMCGVGSPALGNLQKTGQ